MYSYLILILASTLLSGTIVYKLVVTQFEHYMNHYLEETLAKEISNAIALQVAEMLREMNK